MPIFAAWKTCTHGGLSCCAIVGYPDEQPEAKPRDESKVKYIK